MSIQKAFHLCGYSDMAVGLGRTLGFEYLRNFDAPYRAESITFAGFLAILAAPALIQIAVELHRGATVEVRATK